MFFRYVHFVSCKTISLYYKTPRRRKLQQIFIRVEVPRLPMNKNHFRRISLQQGTSLNVPIKSHQNLVEVTGARERKIPFNGIYIAASIIYTFDYCNVKYV